MKFFDVELEGPEVEWEFRDAPGFYDSHGRPRTGKSGEAAKVKRPAYARVTLEAEDKDDAAAKALALEYVSGYRKVLSVTPRAR
jgi:hypothetical protein